MSHSVEKHLRLDVAEYDNLIRKFVPGYEKMLGVVVDTLQRLYPERLHVLDLGTGTGALAFAIASRIEYATLEILDVDPKMLRIAEARLAQFGGRVKVVQRSFAEKLPACDAVVASFSLHHIQEREEKQKVFGNIFSALHSGGIFLNADQTVCDDHVLNKISFDRWAEFLVTQGISEPEARGHFRAWSEEDFYFPLFEELVSLEKAGFRQPECFWREGPSSVYGALKGS